jgi:hypothetical protein
MTTVVDSGYKVTMELWLKVAVVTSNFGGMAF